VCTLTATPSSITAGATSLLTAACSPAATSYTWSSNAGFASTAASGTVRPTIATTYTVTGSNAGGTGNTASATVTVTVSNFLLTVTKSGTGSGTVTSNTGGILRLNLQRQPLRQRDTHRHPGHRQPLRRLERRLQRHRLVRGDDGRRQERHRRL
jgi:hypothetical protein